jgi:hypothetical protein
MSDGRPRLSDSRFRPSHKQLSKTHRRLTCRHRYVSAYAFPEYASLTTLVDWLGSLRSQVWGAGRIAVMLLVYCNSSCDSTTLQFGAYRYVGELHVILRSFDFGSEIEFARVSSYRGLR